MYDVDDQALCERVAEINKNISVVTIVEDSEAVAVYQKPRVPMMNEKRARGGLLQMQLWVAMAKSNEDFLGKFCYTMLHWENSDIFVFVMDKDDNDDAHNNDNVYSNRSGHRLLSLRIEGKYRHDVLVSKVLNLLRQFRLIEKDSSRNGGTSSSGSSSRRGL